ncbi:MAG: aquaporin family protein [Verrucomicrobia bacterium]|nr:aquaporin family protein [Verrucomicrobiota bacterium]
MKHQLAAEFFGTALLLLAVTGSGIMGESLAGGNVAVALLANSLATGAALYVLISLLGPVSGAQLNPVVTLMAWADRVIEARQAFGYLLAQFTGAIAGVWAVHAMFGRTIFQVSTKPRSSAELWFSEFLATCLLLLLIRTGSSRQDARLPAYVALTVTAGYWATSSTFFANPAATVARGLTDTFVGIRPADVGSFLLAQCVALGLVLIVGRRLRS